MSSVIMDAFACPSIRCSALTFAPADTDKLAAVWLKIVRGNRRTCLVNKLAALQSPLEDTSAEVGVAEYAATHVCEYKVIAALTDHEGGQLFGQ
jgi:hypothetical protein